MNKHWNAQDAVHFIMWVNQHGGHCHIDCQTNNGQFVFKGHGRHGESLIESLQAFAEEFGLAHNGAR